MDEDLVPTSVTLPRDLWTKAKVTALNERCDLRDIIIEGLNMVLKVKAGMASYREPTMIPKKSNARILVGRPAKERK